MVNKLQDSYLAAHDQVYRTLRMRIMYGEMRPGQAITLRGVAAEFGVISYPSTRGVKAFGSRGGFEHFGYWAFSDP